MGTGVFSSEAGFSEDNIHAIYSAARNSYYEWLTLIEQKSGYCEFDVGNTCTENSLLIADIALEYMSVTYIWTVTGATMITPQGENYVEISTPTGNENINYTVRLDVVVDGNSKYIEQAFTHEKILAPIRILDIEETSAGSCEL